VHLTELRTPAVLVDAGRVAANITRMQALAGSNGRALRPHVKTHKSPVLARWQLEAGAHGICCAKPGEAEVFADAGFDDVRLAYPVRPEHAPRILSLLDRGVRVSLAVDRPDVVAAWSAAMRAARHRLDVLVKVDVGFHRCGVDPHDPELPAWLVALASMPGLRLTGLISHAGHAYRARSADALAAVADEEARLLHDVAAAARNRGVALGEISVGATPTARYSAAMPGITELRPGNYVYFDRTQVALGAATLDDCALTVLATVVTAHEGRIILDAGSKVLSSDRATGYLTTGIDSRGARAERPPDGVLEGYGAIFADAESPLVIDETLCIERLSEEHATVRVVGTTALRPGDRVRILPNHSCVVANLVDSVSLIDGTAVVERLPVAARGRCD
jgi:D-serine deaminase-like pyridoxal phosphate-dependent protein